MKFKIIRYSGTRNNPIKTEYLSVESDIHFDEAYIFCGKPYVRLFAMKEKGLSHWGNYTIRIGIRDMDDYDVGYIYEPTEERFFDVLHELINWMHDLEMGLCLYNDYLEKLKLDEFFPKLNCKKGVW